MKSQIIGLLIAVTFFCSSCFVIKQCDETINNRLGNVEGYFAKYSSQSFKMPSGKVITISLPGLKFDTSDYFTANDGCKLNYREINIWEIIKTNDTILNDMAIRHSYGKTYDLSNLRIKDWNFKNLISKISNNSVTVNGKTYYDVKNLNLAKYDAIRKIYGDSIQVIYTLNDGFIKITIDSTTLQVYELIP